MKSLSVIIEWTENVNGRKLWEARKVGEVRFGPRTVYWGGRGWDVVLELSIERGGGKGSEIWSKSCLLSWEGWDVVQSCPLSGEGREIWSRTVYKGKVRNRRSQEDCPIQSPPVFQVKVTRLLQSSREAKEERSLEHELLTTHWSQYGTNQQWWPCLTQTDCCFW